MWTNLGQPKNAVLQSGVPTVHFISHIYPTNAADMTYHAGIYFIDMFYSFPCVWHRLTEVELDLIKPADWVIFSGGDIYHPSLTGLFNKLIFLTGGKVISWGCGYNLQENADDRLLDRSLNKRGFAMFSTRDYNFASEFGNPERYVPCVSCMQLGMEGQAPEITREAGVIEHKWHPINDFPQYDKINNSIQALQVLGFIASSGLIITNSYHAVYWATLLGKKVILFGKNASKFDFFKYPPALYSGDLKKDMERAAAYPEALDECRRLNIEYANEVISIIKADDGAKRGFAMDSLFRQAYNTQTSIEAAHQRISELHDHVYPFVEEHQRNAYQRIDETNQRIDDLGQRIDEFNNVHQRIDELGQRIDGFHSVYQRIDETNQRIDELGQRMDEFHKHVYSTINENHGNINRRVDEEIKMVYNRIGSVESNVSKMEENQRNICQRIDEHSQRMDEFHNVNGRIDEEIKMVHNRIDSVESHISKCFWNRVRKK